MEIVVVLGCLVLVLVLIGRPPGGPGGGTQGVHLEAYLREVARRQAQLRQGRLTDW